MHITPGSIRNKTYFINQNYVPQVEKGLAPDKKNHIITFIKTRSRNGMYAWIKRQFSLELTRSFPVLIFPGSSLEALETEADESSIS
jgi:hypothetical protein